MTDYWQSYADHGMVEITPPLPPPVDPEKRREELAFLEGHDADIPTDDQTPMSRPKAPVNKENEKHSENVNASRSTGNGHDEKVLENRVRKSPKNMNELAAELSDNRVPENYLEKVHDLEAGNKSSSASQAEAEVQVAGTLYPHIVWWDGGDDPENPLNWSEPLKIGNIAVISMVTFITQVLQIVTSPGS